MLRLTGRGPLLHGDIAVFFRRPQFPFAAHDFQSVDEAHAGFGRFDDGVDVAPLGRAVGIREEFLVFFDFLGTFGLGIGGFLDLLAMNDIGGTGSAHDGDLGGGPGKGHVGAQILGAHGQIGAAIVLAGDQEQLGHGGLAVTPQQLGPVADDAAPFLLAAGQVAGNVGNGQQRDVEGIAEPNEARGLVRGVDVQATGHDHGLVGDNAHATSVEAGKGGQDVGGEILVGFEVLAIVNDGFDDIPYVVGLVGAVRNDVVEGVLDAHGVVARVHHRRLFHVVGRQVGEQALDLLDGVFVVFAGELSHAAFLVVGHGAAQALEIDLLTGDRLDDFRAGDEHVTGILDHEDKIGHGRGVDRAAGRGAHDCRNLGNHARGHGIAVENLAVAGKGVHALLDAGTARIVDADKRHAGLEGHVHDLADFLGLHLAEAACPGGKVLGVGKHRAAVDQAVAGDHTVRGNVHRRHAEIDATVLNEHVDFSKCPRVKQFVETFAGGQLAPFLLLGDQLVPAHLKDACFARLEILNFFLHNTHVTFLSPKVQNFLTSRQRMGCAIHQSSAS
ncbi:conserved hypothetical protein [Desulfosarcina cetonica]|nr:conserved hypothetical protein [Desulfosarcina cetonica]